MADALGKVPTRPVVGLLASPVFNNAAMDGFALRAEDTAGATEASPVELRIAGERNAGAVATAAAPGLKCALRVATGALTPPPLDTVIAQEKAMLIERQDGISLRVTGPVESGRNLRREGEEYPAGAAFDYKGKRLNSGQIALLSSAGINELSVRRPPLVGLITTGDEVRPPGVVLEPGEIPNANAAWLGAWCAERGLPVAVCSHVADDAARLAGELADAGEAGARVLITSGSASIGRRDVLRAALNSIKARVVFQGVAMRPGKPVLFALLRGGTPVFGLPGNPLATAACMRFLAWPGIRRVLGMETEAPRSLRLATAVRLREGFTHFLLAKREGEDSLASPVDPQRPAQAGALAAADCWLRLKGGRTKVGARVDSYSL